MEFRYRPERTLTGSIDVGSVGNCAICGEDGLGRRNYLMIRTVSGRSDVLRFGPVGEDPSEPEDSFTLEYIRSEYNAKKLMGIVNGFLNSPKNGIVNAIEVSAAEARESCPDAAGWMAMGGADDGEEADKG